MLAKKEQAKTDTVAVSDTMTADTLKGVETVKPQTTAKKVEKSTPQSVYHKVKKGESLSVIAKKYRTTVTKIKQLNGLKSNNIKVGQRLRVK